MSSKTLCPRCVVAHRCFQVCDPKLFSDCSMDVFKRFAQELMRRSSLNLLSCLKCKYSFNSSGIVCWRCIWLDGRFQGGLYHHGEWNFRLTFWEPNLHTSLSETIWKTFQQHLADMFGDLYPCRGLKEHIYIYIYPKLSRTFWNQTSVPRGDKGSSWGCQELRAHTVSKGMFSWQHPSEVEREPKRLQAI